MYGEDRFAQICRIKCENRDYMEIEQYYPPGEVCSFEENSSDDDQKDSSEPLSLEAKQIATDFYRQTPSNMAQHQSFNNLPFSSVPSTTGNNRMLNLPFNNGWPFGQN
jgi:hypothetical protein